MINLLALDLLILNVESAMITISGIEKIYYFVYLLKLVKLKSN